MPDAHPIRSASLCRKCGELALLLVLLVGSGCAFAPKVIRSPLVDEGELFLYLSPLPPAATGLNVHISAVAVVAADGTSVPLTLKLPDPLAGPRERQRLLARGRLPIGSYQGIKITIERATVETEEGLIDLMVAKEGEFAPLDFELKQRDIQVLEAAFLGPSGSRKDSVSLTAPFAIARPLSPLPNLAGYAVIPEDNRVAVFDKDTGRVARMIATGRSPSAVVFDRDGRYAYVTMSDEDKVLVVDLKTHAAVREIRLNVGDHPLDLAFSADGRTLLVVNEGSNSLSFVTPGKPYENLRLAVGNGPTSITVDRQGNRAYITNTHDGTISIVDIGARMVSATLQTDPEPVICRLNRRGDRLYVGHNRSPMLYVFDAVSRVVIQRLNLFGGVSAMKVDPQTDMLYVSSRLGGAIEVFPFPSILPGDTVTGNEPVSYLTIDGALGNLLILQPYDGTIRIVNLISRQERAVIELGDPSMRATVLDER